MNDYRKRVSDEQIIQWLTLRTAAVSAALTVLTILIGVFIAAFAWQWRNQNFIDAASYVRDDFGIALVGGAAAILVHFYLKIAERRDAALTSGVALISDISALLRVITEAGIAEQFVLLAAYPEREGQYPWADAARKEDYFSVFHAHTDRLGVLHNQELAAHVTRFYVFLKASRDATSPLLGRRTPGEVNNGGDAELERRQQVRSIAFGVCKLLKTTYDAGLVAITRHNLYLEAMKVQAGNGGDFSTDRERAEEVRTSLTDLVRALEENPSLEHCKPASKEEEDLRNLNVIRKIKDKYEIQLGGSAGEHGEIAGRDARGRTAITLAVDDCCSSGR